MPRIPNTKGRSAPLVLREGREHQPGLGLARDDEGARGGNVPEISVSELSNALKRTVEDRFGFVRLRGEISNYRGPHSSGHAYFCLKDEGARIDAVVWKTTLVRMRIKPEEGLEVVASGKITTFPGKSSYQIVVESLEPAGVGALMALLEERRRKLAAEGLFDAARKKPLPYLPAVIGVVTSPTGAVIRDILHRVAGRFPRHVVVWPVRVQGETSGAEIAAAIRGFNALLDDGRMRRPDVIIVARGGGSLEDLWGFNDEAVVRAVGDGVIPLISAVGHETDWTLIDHAADMRAPTPTGAAEIALPVLGELLAAVDRLRGRQNSAALRHLDRAQGGLRALVRLLPSGPDLLSAPRQRLDRTTLQLPSASRTGHDRARLALARLSHRLGTQSPQARMARAAQRLIGVAGRLEQAQRFGLERRRTKAEALGSRLRTGFSGRIRLTRSQQVHEGNRLKALGARLVRAGAVAPGRGSNRLDRLGQMLSSLGYRSVLARGYAVVHGPDGSALRTTQAICSAGTFVLEVADGRIDANVGPGAGNPAPGLAVRLRTAKPRRKGDDPESPAVPQGSLFDL